MEDIDVSDQQIVAMHAVGVSILNTLANGNPAPMLLALNGLVSPEIEEIMNSFIKSVKYRETPQTEKFNKMLSTIRSDSANGRVTFFTESEIAKYPWVTQIAQLQSAKITSK